MSRAKMMVRPPALPPVEFFADARHSIMSDDGSALLSYDAATHTGFIYGVTTETWTISTPVDFATWALLVRSAGLTISDSADSRRWYRAVCPHPAGGSVVDFPTQATH